MTKQWDNSPELQSSVRFELANWGSAYRGGYPNLGYRKKVNFYTPPRDRRDLPPPPIEPDWEMAERTDAVLKAWVQSTTGKTRFERAERNVQKTLVLRYVHGMPTPEIAKTLRLGNRRVRQMLKECVRRYWEMSRSD